MSSVSSTSHNDDTSCDYNPDPTASHAVGSFNSDLLRGYDLKFDSFAHFQAWLRTEERKNGVEYQFHDRTVDNRSSSLPVWRWKVIYYCGRQRTGGKKSYVRGEGVKQRGERKIGPKHCGCSSKITLKAYPGTSTLLACYKSEHSHAIGDENLKYTHLPEEAREQIRLHLRNGMEPSKILEAIRGKAYTEANLDTLRSGSAVREEFVTRDDIRRIEREIESEVIRLHKEDIISVKLWVSRLRDEGHFVYLKCADEPAPPDSGLDDDAFVLIIQTRYQDETWRKFGHRFAGIDGTHNTTFYDNTGLFTIICRDDYGHGMPAAWMIANNGRQTTISAFLTVISSRHPDVKPVYFMTDKDFAQINSIRVIYAGSVVLLCWWHVLRAWRQHFNTNVYLELWNLMRRWVRITDPSEFDNTWERIQATAPASLVEYLHVNWMPPDILRMWSGVYRTGRTIFQTCDTNMLVESWHRLLKHFFMAGKHGRRLDQLIHILTQIALPFFIHRHRRQEKGFEGQDITDKARSAAARKGSLIPASDIEFLVNENIYYVCSQSGDRTARYTVHADSGDCTCAAFSEILYCKHVAAVERHFPASLQVELDGHRDRENAHAPTDQTKCGHRSLTSCSRPRTDDNADALFLSQLKTGLVWMANHLGNMPSSFSPSSSLRALNNALQVAIHDARQDQEPGAKQPLPPTRHIAPRQMQKNLTAAAMGVDRKGKRRRIDDEGAAVDTFRAGEAAGKKAQPDALALPKTSSNPVLEDPTIPDALTLAGLKQAKLQQLCRANGVQTSNKNQTMITRLIERATAANTTSAVPSVPGDDPQDCPTDPVSHLPVVPSLRPPVEPAHPPMAPVYPSQPHSYDISTPYTHFSNYAYPYNYYPNMYSGYYYPTM